MTKTIDQFFDDTNSLSAAANSLNPESRREQFGDLPKTPQFGDLPKTPVPFYDPPEGADLVVEPAQVCVIYDKGFQPGPHGSLVLPANPRPGDCAKCGFEKEASCDGDGTIPAGTGFRHCPHLSVAELLRRRP